MQLFITLLLIASGPMFGQAAGPKHQPESQKGPQKPPPHSGTVSQLPKDWTFIKPGNSQDVPDHPTADPTGGWKIGIPRSPGDADPCGGSYPQCVWLGYFITPYTTPLLQGHSIAATFELTATGGTPSTSFQTEDFNTIAGGCTTPANVRLYFEVRHENGSIPTDRWWYDPQTFALIPNSGPTTITAMIDPNLWSDVDGHRGYEVLPAFTAALKNVGNVGATAGGGCFFGHGVFAVGGTEDLHMIQYGVN